MRRDLASERVLVWAPRGRDTELALQVLGMGGHTAVACSGAAELAAEIEKGAGCAVLTEEALAGGISARLAEVLAAQEPWADFPFIVFGEHRRLREAVDRLGNVTVLERPVQVGTMLSAVRAALRGRRRQYEAGNAIQLRDQFLAMLGHELRNPLGAITLAVEVLGSVEGGKGSKQRAVIARQARHLGRLVDDLLDVSRVTTGKVLLKRAPVDLDELTARCVQSAEAVARARSQQIALNSALGALMVDGDAVRLEQVISNLLTNAMKYSPVGSRIDVSCLAEGDWAVVRVQDPGIGIAPEMLPRIFDLFAQADASLDRAQGGLGIGLTVARSLVELHGGTIGAHSDGPGRGSVFTMRIPLARPDRRVASPAHQEKLPRLSLRVVLVEDNADIRETLKDLLESRGYELHVAEDGNAGLAAILTHRPQVAFVDIGLPGLDGYTVARKVRASLQNTVRLVAMTGYGQPEDRQRAHEAGFDEHVTKPLTLPVLEEVLLRASVPSGAGRQT
jgi:signal transduction histidine kinase/CheY-like chemotaxis protein